MSSFKFAGGASGPCPVSRVWVLVLARALCPPVPTTLMLLHQPPWHRYSSILLLS